MEKSQIERQKVRSLIDNFYDIQKLRISVGNRLYAVFNAGTEEEQDEKVIEQLNEDYNMLTKDYTGKSKRISSRIEELKHDLTVIKDETGFKLVDEHKRLLEMEKDSNNVIKNEVEKLEIWHKFFNNVKGCGPLMAAVCISYLDPYKARHCSSFWKYAGLDVVVTENSEGELISEGRCRRHTEEVEYTDKEGNVKTKKGLTYNPFLKTKLVGVLGGCFVKSKGSEYNEIYLGYKNRLLNTNKYKDYSKGHINNMAIRYAVKMFLRDLWVNWRQVEGLPVTEPYEQAYLGKKEHGFNY